MALVDVRTRRTSVVVPVPKFSTTGPMHTQHIGLALVGLPSGALRLVDVDLTGVASDTSLAWSPDGRWVFCVETTNALVAVEVSSGAVSLLDPRLPSVSQLAIRMGS